MEASSDRWNAVPLPTSTLTHITVGFEEKLFSQTVPLLSSVLSSSLLSRAPAYTPPAEYLALLATLIVHPHFTTRTTEAERHLASNDAARYLRQLVETVSPTDSELQKAFLFHRVIDGRSVRRRQRMQDVSSDEENDLHSDSTSLRTQYAREQSLWERAEDFWAVVGWCFTCSVIYPARWERWRVWLEIVLNILQVNVAEITHSNNEASIVKNYFSSIGVGRGNKRRIMRAIFADGSKTSVDEFREVWARETAPAKPVNDGAPPTKRRRLDLENDEYGNYFDPESEEEVDAAAEVHQTDSSIRRPRRTSRHTETPRDLQFREDDTNSPGTSDGQSLSSAKTSNLGGADSIRLRQQLMNILLLLSKSSPDEFLPVEDVLSLFTEFLRPLPLPIFQLFVLPTRPFIDLDLQITLNEMLFQELTGHMGSFITGGITQEALVDDFAPYAATSISVLDNAKVSLLLESFVRGLWSADLLEPSSKSLRDSLRKGIEAREAKCRFDGRKKGSGQTAVLDNEARKVMSLSAQRMQLIVGSSSVY